MAETLIYHGSYKKIKKPEIRASRNTKDFGEGFYCTNLREQAARWTRKYKTSVLNIYSFKIGRTEKLKIKEFKTMTDEWLDFIINCRNGQKHEYDIVIGAMADDQIYNFISDYLEGNITREQFWILAKFKYPTHQIVFCTEDALKSINFLKSEVIEHDR